MELPYKRALTGAVLAVALVGAIPATVLAANPACGATLTSDRTLTSNLDCSGYAGTALTLGKKGITLNLNGHKLIGPDSSSGSNYGVYSEYKNVTVRNGTIQGFYYGVYFYAVVAGTAKGLTVIGSTGSTTDEGIYFEYGTNHVIKNNTVSGVRYGIDVEYAANDWITNNTVTATDSTGYGIYIYDDSEDHVTGNHITHNWYGVYDDESGHQTYENNTANGSDATGATGFYFYCNSDGWVHATNNTATHNGDYGFYLYDCYDDYSPYETERTWMVGNKALDNGDDAYGYYDEYSINAVWDGNVAKRSGSVGFYMAYPGFVVFKNNVANNNGDDGIYAYSNVGSGYENFKLFKNNTANGNDAYGIDADYGISNASGNIAHNNGNAPDNCYNVACN